MILSYIRNIFNKKSIFWISCAVVLWVALVVILIVSVKNGNSSFSYKFKSADDLKDLPVEVNIIVSQSWEDKMNDKKVMGAEYDGTVINKVGKEIKDWKITVTLPEDDGYIDSSWNGTYELNGSTLKYVPDQNVYTIEKEKTRTFGFVLKSMEIYKDFEYEITGRYVTYKEDYVVYWILIVLSIVYVVTFVMFAAMQIKLEIRRRNDDEIIRQTMMMFVNSIDARDEYTKGHSVRVAEYSQLLAKEMGFDRDEVRKIGYIALLHDCGKIVIEDSLLKKPGKLTPEERHEIQQHTVIGGKMLEGFTSLKGAREGALYHHEFYNGEGYPEGLKGKDIPLPARIICVADSFDAMNSDRCYRKHLGKQRVIEEITDNRGIQFDPDIADCMIRLIENGKIHVSD